MHGCDVNRQNIVSSFCFSLFIQILFCVSWLHSFRFVCTEPYSLNSSLGFLFGHIIVSYSHFVVAHLIIFTKVLKCCTEGLCTDNCIGLFIKLQQATII